MQFPADTVIQLNNVLIEGGTVYPFNEVAAPFAELIGQQVSLKQLVDITNRITQRYQDDGYALSYAFIPAQNMSLGQVRVVLVEGYVAALDMRGDIGAASERIRKFADNIINEKPLRKATFERYTALMARIPGVKVKASVPKPTTTDGAVTMVTEATRQNLAVSSALELNDGDDAKLLVSAELNSNTAAGEKIKVTTMLPPGDDKERYARVDYSQFIGNNGTRLEASASAYRSEKDEKVNLGQVNTANGPVNVLSQEERSNDRISVGFSHPVRLSNNESIMATARVYGVDDERDYRVEAPGALAGREAKITNKVRALALEGEWKKAEKDQLRIISGGLYQGLDMFGAESSITTLAGNRVDHKEVDFLRMRLAGVQSNIFADRWQSIVSGAAYWSADALPDSERATFGGRSFGRGYDSDQAEGDKGWGLAYELGYRFYPELSWMRLLKPYAVIDTARASYNDNGGPDARLGSYAIGVQFSDQRHYSLSLEAAKPFGDKATDSQDRDPRFRLNASYNL
ncbi:ShlB/FhaC/HecB family hemolysin secretion/activation protein [Oceanimonas smirnovii]|uniref:ShlB/FhaC/HecB family hemolysin secretion/activation protein n=1 Tax=Oceanimonas smirnovii TaxID=264574 RepID=UPI0003652BA4|nr:POTRA domain-containing protein [Oceanimonas smirnovii]